MLRFATIARFGTGIAALGVCLGLLTPSARATEGSGTAFPLGISTVNPGLTAPPGLSFLSYDVGYEANHLRNSRGTDALRDFHVSLEISALTLNYFLPARRLPEGISLGFEIIQPVFHQDLGFRPRGAGAEHHASTFGLGDLTLVPLYAGFVGHGSLGTYAFRVKVPVTIPTGVYDPHVFLNRGRNAASFLPQLGAQWFPKPDLSIGATANYVYNTGNPATCIVSGQELVVEYAAQVRLGQTVWAGAQGYVYRQITPDLLRGREMADGHFGSAMAVGPQVRWSPHALSATIKWQHEFDVHNRPDGERFWLQVLVPLGG